MFVFFIKLVISSIFFAVWAEDGDITVLALTLLRQLNKFQAENHRGVFLIA